MPLQQLTEKIYTALPDLKELGVGCRTKFKDSDALTFTCFSIKNDLYRFVDQNGTTYAWSKYSIKESFEIIGKPITLTDVLRWMKDLSQNEAYAIEVDGCLLVNRGGEWTALTYLNSKNNNEILFWDLNHNLLENQSIELVEFLNNL